MPDRVPLDTSVNEYQRMRMKKMCSEQHTEYEDDKWVFFKTPKPEYRWMSKATRALTNCLLEELSLIKEEEYPINNSPLGRLNSTLGHFMHNHMTLIWDNSIVPSIIKRRVLADHRTGFLVNASQGILRLEDDKKQADYHLVRTPICRQGNKECLNSI